MDAVTREQWSGRMAAIVPGDSWDCRLSIAVGDAIKSGEPKEEILRELDAVRKVVIEAFEE